MVKVSVVIPVYNGEKYLRQCLDSVCNQTLKEIEIICVDDGSTDDSYRILEEYKEKDDRFILLKQQNKFAGAARNNGKQYASGEYMIFWDCDDFFRLDALEILYNQASKCEADVCVCGGSHFYEVWGKVVPYTGYLQKKRIPEEEVFSIKTNEDYILNFTNEAAWNKLYKRSYIENLNLNFQEVRNGNDVYFTINAMCLAERITTVVDQLVIYRKNQTESLVGTLYKSPLTPFKAWIDAAENLMKHERFPEKSFTNKFCGSMAYLLRNINNYEAFKDAVMFLREEGLQRLHVRVREEGYYYTQWHNELVAHLINDDIGDFQTYLAYRTYIELTEQNAKIRLEKQAKDKLKSQKQELSVKVKSLTVEIKKLTEKIDKLKKSKAYKLGSFILYIPRKIKKMFRK